MKRPRSAPALALLVLLVTACGTQSQVSPQDRSGFVYLAEHVPGVRIEPRYYSMDNFLGTRVDGYRRPVILVCRPAADALAKVQQDLAARGLGLKVFDAYRPQKAVDHFVRWAKDAADTKMKSRYYPEIPKDRLFELGYIAEKSGHTRGSAVDLTLVHQDTGEELDMGSRWDFFGETSHHDSPLVGELATRNREILRRAMVEHGFEPYPNEWWHYSLAREPYPETYFDFDVR